MSKDNFNFKPFLISIFIVFIYLIIIWINKNVIFDVSFYYKLWQTKFSTERIERIIVQNNKFSIFSYLFWPCVLYIKWLLICIVLYIGIIFFEIDMTFKNCFKIVLLAESIPLILLITKTLYFYIYPPNSLELVQNFNPLGLTSILKYDHISTYFLYPIQQINLFEVGYWLLLAYGINSLGNVDLKKSLKVVTLSYGFGLTIWCIFIVFIQLQFS
jgi:hypothetical protein